MRKESRFPVCLACLNLDNVVSRETAEATVVQLPPKKPFSAVVCKRCLSLDRITRVTCRTFRPIALDETAREG